jgi:hypothetical protein
MNYLRNSVSSSSTGDDINDVSDPRLTNFYAPYKLQTPSKLTGSFGARGLISIDYAIKDYSKTKFKPESDSYYKSLNNFMTTTRQYRRATNSAEYKIEKLSLRAGYRIEQSPYKNKTTVGDLTGYLVV